MPVVPPVPVGCSSRHPRAVLRALAAEAAVVAASLGGAPTEASLQQRALLLLSALNIAIRSAPNRDVLSGARGRLSASL